MVQMPLDLIINIIYLGVQINPIAITGLLAYFVIFPVMSMIMGKVITYDKKITSLRDLRVKRSTEVMSGIKIVKMFSLE